MSRTFLVTILVGATLAAAPAPVALAAPQFVNGLTLPGDMLDESKGTDANTGRVGFFSDIYYDVKRKHWYGLSDRGPGGGTLHYETRVQRFKLDIDKKTGGISKFKIVDTIIFKDELGQPLDGIAPNPTSQLGNSFDPEGFVVHPETQHFLVSDEYGPSLYEFDRNGVRVRTFTIPANLIPRNATTGTPNYAGDEGNTAGKRTNRGFEGLAISPDGAYVYAMLQSAMLDEGGGNGVCNRIVKFDTETGTAVAQYAYEMEGRRRAAASPPWWRRQRARVPRARAQQPRHRRRGGDLAAEQESLPHRPDRRGRRQPRDVRGRRRPPARSPRPAPSSTSRPTRCPRSATRCRRSGRALRSARS